VYAESTRQRIINTRTRAKLTSAANAKKAGLLHEGGAAGCSHWGAGKNSAANELLGQRSHQNNAATTSILSTVRQVYILMKNGNENNTNLCGLQRQQKDLFDSTLNTMTTDGGDSAGEEAVGSETSTVIPLGRKHKMSKTNGNHGPLERAMLAAVENFMNLATAGVPPSTRRSLNAPNGLYI
jgi:hypothetical protein